MDEIAVVILNYNGKNYLEQFLPTLIYHSSPARVIVADNQSTDDSVDYLQRVFPDVELIVLDKNYGYAGGYNEALKQIDAKYFLLINSDVEVTPKWIQPLLNLLEQNPAIASVQPKIRSFHEKQKFEYAGAAGGYLDWLGYPYCRGRIFDTTEEDHGQYDDALPVFWATGACFLIRSKDFFEAGMFDADFFAHMEEIDLCWRLNAMGKEVWYEPRSIVYHVGGGTLAKTNPWKTELNFRNGLILLFKNLPAFQLYYKFPLRIMLDFIAAMKFLIGGEWRHSLAVFKAILGFISGIRGNTVKRKAIKSKASISQFKKSGKLIIWEYFIKGKKKYSAL